MWSEKVFLVIGCILHSHSVLSLWSCTQDSDCSTTVGSYCSSGSCVCPAGKQLALGGSLCAEASPYYTSPCLEDHQCSNLVTSFQCRRTGDTEEGNCFCQSGFHYFRGRCWRSVEFGAFCRRDEECMGVLKDPFSLTCRAGTCGCSEGYYERQRGECRRIGRAVGDGCVLNEDCQFPKGVCDPNSLRCVDSTSASTFADTVRNNATSRSLGRSHGTACDSTTSCPSPFVCSPFRVCVCPTGYYSSDDGTECFAELGSPSTETQCVGFLAEVIDGVCSCPSNIYFEENMRDCVKPTRRLMDACVSDQMCHTFGAAARCTGPQPPWGFRHCECNPEYSVWDEARSMCRLFVGIGEQCQVSSDCLAGAMEIECVLNSDGQGICACPPGFVAVDGLCLTSGLGLGDSCQASQECTGAEHSVCEDGRCSCGEGYQELDGICAPTIGGTCVVDTDCTIPNTICTGNGTLTCQCDSQFVEHNDICWPTLSSPTTPCEVTPQCTELLGAASSCVDSKCQCNEENHLRDGRCWPKIGLFESCGRNSECYLNDISDRVVCRNSLCQCSFDFPYSERLQTCTSAASMTMSSILTIVLSLIYVILH